MDAILRSVSPGAEQAQVSINKEFQETATKGCKFVKHSWHGRPHSKTVKVDITTGKAMPMHPCTAEPCNDAGLIRWGTGSLDLKNALEV